VGKIVSINVSKNKGEKKAPVTEAFVSEHGIKGDGHSGKWHRQVSLLSYESIKELNKKGASADCGDFAENLTTRGIALNSLKIGDILVIGSINNNTGKDKDSNKFSNNLQECIHDKTEDADGSGKEVILKVTQIGKECPKPCSIYYLVGYCIMPEEGIFCQVLKPGKIKTGDSIFVVKN